MMFSISPDDFGNTNSGMFLLKHVSHLKLKLKLEIQFHILKHTYNLNSDIDLSGYAVIPPTPLGASFESVVPGRSQEAPRGP